VKGGSAEVVAWGIDKWWRAHSSPPEVPRYADKAPRRVAAAATHSPTSPLPFHSSSSSDREAERAIPQGDFLLLFSHLPPSSPLRESVVWFVVDYLS
jgi:hypothetical protein